MKSFKKVLSIALALLMLCSCIAVSSISASALTLAELDNEKYDDNILFTGDEFIRDYSYATVQTDNWPRQVSYNEDGWMRMQSQTAEEIAAGEAGTFDNQWSLHFIPTPEYKKQFKNAVKYSIEEGSSLTHQYFYVKSAQHVGSKSTTDDIECVVSYTIRYDSNEDGVLDESDYSTKISFSTFTSKHAVHDYQYLNDTASLGDVADIAEGEMEFDLTSVTFQPRYYKDMSKGVGLLDLYISPLYVNTVPGTDVKFDDADSLDIRTYLGKTTFTSGKLDRDGNGDPLNDWQWKEWVKGTGEHHEPVYGADEYGKKADLVREKGTGCPIMADGTVYNPIPIVQVVEEGDVVISDLKAAVDGKNATVTWKNTGSQASKYEISYKKDGKFVAKDTLTTETYAFTGLEAGKYEATVVGFNVEGKRGTQVKVEFEIAGAAVDTPADPTPEGPTACVHATTTVANKVDATYFAAGFTGDVVCASCGEVITAGKTVAKLKFKKPSVTVKGAKKQLKVTYKKVAGATGFQVRYKIKGAWKVVNYNNVKKNVTKTIKKLKKGNYKVQLRVFVKNGKKTVYSAWSKTAKAKVK